MKHDQIFSLINQELERQTSTLQLIPSENFASPNVMTAVGSCLMNKYSEGYPGRRYYEGNEIIDQIESLALERAKLLFKVPYVNVQPYSGSPANAAIEMALLERGDTMMGLQLSSGGHLTHGHPKVSFGGKFFRTVQFGLDQDARIDFAEFRRLALAEKPKVIIIGTTAYPFKLDFAKFAEVADEIGAYLVADISHITGLIIAGAHPDPVPYAHIVMTTTHKTLRGPRGAMILVTEKGLTKDIDLGKKIDQAVFPGLQGGPHNNVTAGIAVALQEAMTAEYKEYGQQVVRNARVLADRLMERELKLVGNGTENHLMIIDLRDWGGGTQLAYAMAQAGLYANKNTVPNEPNSPFYPSGVRLGTPAVTTRGMGEKEMVQIADWIADIENLTKQFALPPEKSERTALFKKARAWAQMSDELKAIRADVKRLCDRFPLEK
jgi:glycine hydroxymethyltransferase